MSIPNRKEGKKEGRKGERKKETKKDKDRQGSNKRVKKLSLKKKKQIKKTGNS